MGLLGSMVIGYFDIIGIAIAKSEADAPLIVNGNGVLSMAIIFQLVQPVARRHLQVVQAHGIIKKFQPSYGTGQQFRGQSPRFSFGEQLLRVLVGETFYHRFRV